MSRRLSPALWVLPAVLSMAGCSVHTDHRHRTGSRTAAKTARADQGRPVYDIVGDHENGHSARTARRGARGAPPDHAPAHGHRFQYVYYPSVAVYYSPAYRRYYWPSATGWTTGKAPPSTITIDPNDGVSIELDSDVPYLHHAEVAAKHPGRVEDDEGDEDVDDDDGGWWDRFLGRDDSDDDD